jgi:hypothetical protein
MEMAYLPEYKRDLTSLLAFGTGKPSKRIELERVSASGSASINNKIHEHLHHGDYHNTTNITQQLLLPFLYNGNILGSTLNHKPLPHGFSAERASLSYGPTALYGEPSIPPADLRVSRERELSADPSGTDDQYDRALAKYLYSKIEEIEDIYDELLRQHRTATAELGCNHKYLEIVRRDISEQKLRFGVTSETLARTWSRTSLTEATSTGTLYMTVLERLDEILNLMKKFPNYFDKIFNLFKVSSTNFRLYATLD